MACSPVVAYGGRTEGERYLRSSCFLSQLGFIATTVGHGWYAFCTDDLICDSKRQIGLAPLKKKNCIWLSFSVYP